MQTHYIIGNVNRQNAKFRKVLDGVALQIQTGPGRTERELTRALFGKDLLYSRVNIQCRRLIKEGRVYRTGLGNRIDPYRYFPANPAPDQDSSCQGVKSVRPGKSP